jgi:hypothetical protein
VRPVRLDLKELRVHRESREPQVQLVRSAQLVPQDRRVPREAQALLVRLVRPVRRGHRGFQEQLELPDLREPKVHQVSQELLVRKVHRESREPRVRRVLLVALELQVLREHKAALVLLVQLDLLDQSVRRDRLVRPEPRARPVQSDRLVPLDLKDRRVLLG